MSFNYLIDKINQKPMETFPFKHLEILDFLSSEHLAEILNTPEIKLPPAASDAALLDNLINLGYKPIPFPGTTRNIDEYLTWHANKGKHTNIETCEGIGMTLRLMERKSQILIELDEFFNSEEFLSCIANKFNLDRSATYPDNGLQKYLDGYEISPHPDIRKKALTYMLNVNPDPNSQLLSFHTHYMTFIDNKRYVQEYWRYNKQADRCWVPWDWCKTEKMQTANNSLVMFEPADDTLHAVKANYDHLSTQRTQYYGNLWYHESLTTEKPNWRDYVISATPERKSTMPIKDRILSLINKATTKGNDKGGY